MSLRESSKRSSPVLKNSYAIKKSQKYSTKFQLQEFIRSHDLKV